MTDVLTYGLAGFCIAAVVLIYVVLGLVIRELIRVVRDGV